MNQETKQALLRAGEQLVDLGAQLRALAEDMTAPEPLPTEERCFFCGRRKLKGQACVCVGKGGR